MTGVIAGLPAPSDRGVRFELVVEQAATDAVSLPPRMSLTWYASQARVEPGVRWALTVRLRWPHGVFNPGGFDLEGWLFERNLRATGYVREAPPPQRVAPML